MKTVTVLAGLACLLSACGDKVEPIAVSRASFKAEGKEWPLKVDAGTVGCTKPKGHPEAEQRWFLAPDGKRYGLNGFATKAAGYEDLTPIWLEDVAMNREVQAAFPDQKVTIVNRISIAGLSLLAAEAC